MARTDSDKVAAITVAQRPPTTQHHDPEPPYHPLGTFSVCLASSLPSPSLVLDLSTDTVAQISIRLNVLTPTSISRILFCQVRRIRFTTPKSALASFLRTRSVTENHRLCGHISPPISTLKRTLTPIPAQR